MSLANNNNTPANMLHVNSDTNLTQISCNSTADLEAISPSKEQGATPYSPPISARPPLTTTQVIWELSKPS